MLALGLYLVYEALQLPFGSLSRPGPGFYPAVLAVLLAGVSAAILFHSLKPGASRLLVGFGARTTHIAITAAAILVYGLLLEAIGFLLCTFVLVLALLVAFGKVPWLRSLVIAAAGTIAVYLAFTNLGIPLPKGVLAF